MTMYKEYFGLEESPFSIAPDPRFLYMSQMHREALAHLVFGVKSDGGFVMLTGEVGTGKTTVCRCLLELIPENVDVAFVLNPKVTALELLATICDELHIDYPPDNTSIKIFVDRINTYLIDSNAKDRKTVLLIDEAQNLETDVLEQIRLLTNLETDQRKLLQIIMIGQPELQDLLERQELRQLSQRITARYHLKPLQKKEVAAYINHRLKIAGQHAKIFSAPTIDNIASLSKGIPRMINILCDRAMLGAYVEGHDQINRQILRKAAKEILGETMHKKSSRGRVKNQNSFWAAIVAGLAFLLFVFSMTSYYLLRSADIASRQALISRQATPLTSLTDADAAPLASKKDTAEEKVNPPLPAPKKATQSAEPTAPWPSKVSKTKSLAATFHELFSSWDITFLPNSTDTACVQAKKQGLKCMFRRGSLGSLRNLDRPVALNLKSTAGHEFYAPLISLSPGKATLVLNNNPEVFSIPELEKYWDGSYILIWRIPPSFTKPIKPGAKGKSVLWLARQMAIIDNQDVKSVKATKYNGKLLQRVKTFQQQAGLIADGVVGPQTVIHINSNVGIQAPRLIANKAN